MTIESVAELAHAPYGLPVQAKTAARLEQPLDFYDLTRAELAAVLKDVFTVPGYKAIQLFQWVYRKGVQDFSEMTDISAYLRKELEQIFTFSSAEIVERQISSDGSRKYLLRVGPGQGDHGGEPGVSAGGKHRIR